MAQLIPVDPSSEVFKDLMAVDAANTQPQTAGTKKLVPVDPSSPEFKAIMTGQDLADRQAAAKPGAQPNEARVQEVQKGLHAQTKDEPLFMEKYGLPKPPGSEMMQKASMPIAQFMIAANPYGRAANALIGAGSSAAEDISQGKVPSPIGMAIGGIGGAIGPEIAKVGKAAYRGAASMFGRGPLKKAGSAIMEETKALTKPVSTTATEQELLSQSKTFGRTAEPQVQKGVTDMFDKIAGAKAAGQPLTYGEVFKNARSLNEDIHSLYKSGNKQAAGELEKVYEKMMQDMAGSGPEAQQAVDAYRRAVGAFGGWEGAKQVAKRVAMYGAGAGGIISGALSPKSLVVSAPAALIGAIANLSTRLPFGVGQGIATALIKDPGSISTSVARMLAQEINSVGKEY